MPKRPVSSIEGESEVMPKQQRRRRRTFYTKAQIARLEEAFNEENFPGYVMRDQLATELGINEDRIQVWFQNRRSRLRRTAKNKPAAKQPSNNNNALLRAASPESRASIPSASTALTYCNTKPLSHVPPRTISSQEESDFHPASLYPGMLPFQPFSFLPNLDFATGVPSVARAVKSDSTGRGDWTFSTHTVDEYAAAAGLLSVFTTANPCRHE